MGIFKFNSIRSQILIPLIIVLFCSFGFLFKYFDQEIKKDKYSEILKANQEIAKSASIALDNQLLYLKDKIINLILYHSRIKRASPKIIFQQKNQILGVSLFRKTRNGHNFSKLILNPYKKKFYTIKKGHVRGLYKRMPPSLINNNQTFISTAPLQVNQFSFLMAFPLSIERKEHYVFAFLDPSTLLKLLKETSHKDTKTYIADTSTKKVIAHTNLRKIGKKIRSDKVNTLLKNSSSFSKYGFASIKTLSDTNVVCGISQIKKFGLTIISETDEKIAFHAYRTFMLNIGGIFLIIFITVMAFSILIARSFIKPILHLSRAAKQIGRGDFDIEIPVSSQNEI
jgi:nitrogen fixation/metabolism regulation signal transduction histidine kinase